MTGYAVGSGCTILKTTNGGANWVGQATGPIFGYYSVHSPGDAQTAYAAGTAEGIIKTTNGGTDWFYQAPATPYRLHCIQFPVDALTGYAVAEWGSIVKTTDGGVWVEEANQRSNIKDQKYRIGPNPFTSFATVFGRESEIFAVYDVTGTEVGTYRGSRIGAGLAPGVYFLKPAEHSLEPIRIVKIR
jgi:hypothetical protein